MARVLFLLAGIWGSQEIDNENPKRNTFLYCGSKNMSGVDNLFWLAGCTEKYPKNIIQFVKSSKDAQIGLKLIYTRKINVYMYI